MVGGRNVLFEGNVSVCAEKASLRSSLRDCVRFCVLLVLSFFLNIQMRHQTSRAHVQTVLSSGLCGCSRFLARTPARQPRRFYLLRSE